MTTIQGQWPSYDGYMPLDVPRHEIRLLQIGLDKETNTVSCNIHTVSLDDQPVFYALSYYWGAPVPVQKLRIVAVEGSAVFVRPTLEMFLRSLTAHVGSTKVWLDALCINQSDVSERGSQVAMMGTIYRSARATYTWLGESNADTDYVCDFINTGNPAQAANPPALEDYIEQLFTRPYWKRRWIIQEFILSKEIWIVVGDNAVKWTQLNGVATKILSSSHSRRKQQRSRQRPGQTLSESWRTYTRMDNLRRKLVTSQGALLELMSQFHENRCVDDRDKVYALLALTSDNVVDPDYSISTSELYFRVLQSLTPECQAWPINEYGHEIFESIISEGLVRQQIAILGIDFRQCLLANDAHCFSSFFCYQGKIRLTPRQESSSALLSVEQANVSLQSYSMWLPQMHGALKNPSFDTKVKLCRSHPDEEHSQSSRGSAYASRRLQHGDSVFSLGPPHSILACFRVITRGSRVVDVAIEPTIVNNLIELDNNVRISLREILLIKHIILKGVRMCKKEICCLVKQPTVRSQHLLTELSTWQRALYRRGSKTLFHIDRSVLCMLSIMSSIVQKDIFVMPKELRAFLSIWDSIMPEMGLTISTNNPTGHAAGGPCDLAPLDHNLLRHYEFVKKHSAQLQSPKSPMWGHLYVSNKHKEAIEDRECLTENFRRNHRASVIASKRQCGMLTWRDWYHQWFGKPGISGVLFSRVIEDNRTLPSLFMGDSIWHSDYMPIGLIIRTHTRVRKFGPDSMLPDLDIRSFPLKLSSLEECKALRVSDDLLLTAGHSLEPKESSLDLNAFLQTRHVNLVRGSRFGVDFIRVSSVALIDTFVESVTPPIDYTSLYPPSKDSTCDDMAIAFVEEPNVQGRTRNLRLEARDQWHKKTILKLEVRQTTGSEEENWSQAAINLNDGIVWVENYGLRFATAMFKSWRRMEDARVHVL